MDGNLSIADVLALQQDGRNYDYDGAYCRRGGRGMAATFNLDVTQSLRSLNGATGGASTSTASALAQAEALAMLMNGGTMGRNNGQVCPTPVAIYQPAMPCSCNTCGN